MMPMRYLRHPRRLALPALAAAALALSACAEEHSWNLRDISGVMPELEFELTRAADGDTVTEDTYQGKVTVLFFGFTNCPDVCPLTMSKFAGALDGMERADDVRFLFVSVDPERDTPEVLQRYTGGFGDRFVGLRGDIATLRDLTKRYRVTFSHGEADEHGHYDVSHSSAAFVFDRDGDIRLLARQDDSVDDIRADLEHLVAG